LSVPDGVFAPYEVVCAIGARPNPVYVVRSAVGAGGGKSQLVIAEHFAGGGRPGQARSADLVREARRISALVNPHVARAREVAFRGEDLVVFGDFIEGEKLSELWSPNRLTLEIALRVIIDVLSGLSALHNLRDAEQRPMKLVHGEVSPATIVFGLDGAARVLEAVARRVPGVRAEAASFGYLAPEIHRGEPYDARADVFSAGVLLWEALDGRRLFTETDPEAIVARIRANPVPLASVPEKVAWARGLVDVAAKALAVSPEDRWPAAAALATEIRKLAGLKLAPASTASAFAKSVIGDRVKARRQRLEPTRVSARPAPPIASTRVSARPAPPIASTRPVLPRPLQNPSSPNPPLPNPPSPPPVPVRSPPTSPIAPSPVRIITVEATAPPPPPVLVVPTPPSPVPAVETPISIWPGPYPEPMMTAPAVSEDSEPSVRPPRPVARRRTAMVLGSVGAFGLLVFALAAWRINHGNGVATPETVKHTAATQSALRAAPPTSPGPSVVATAAPPAIAPPAPITPAVPNPTPTPPAAAAAAPPHATAATKPKSPQAAAPAPAPAPTHPRPVASIPSPARPQPKSKPTFEPNSL
jgi:hypothetical protein